MSLSVLHLCDFVSSWMSAPGRVRVMDTIYNLCPPLIHWTQGDAGEMPVSELKHETTEGEVVGTNGSKPPGD